MPFRVWYGDDYWDFDDDTPDSVVDDIGYQWQQLGDLNAVRQKFALESLSSDENFLALPRIERHSAFNKLAQNGPYWNLLEPEARRALRGLVVDVEGANPQEALSFWDAPVSKSKADIWDKIEAAGLMGYFPGGQSESTQKMTSTIAELGRAFERTMPKILTGIPSGLATMADTFAGFMEESPITPLSPMGGLYTNPLWTTGAAEAAHKATGKIAKGAREIATNASIGSDLLAEGRKYKSLQEGMEEGGLGGLAQAGAAVVGEQLPIMGSIMAASAVPVVGPALGVATSMGLQTNSISEDLQRQGLTGEDADIAASTLGVLTGAMEYLPVGRLLGRNPIVAKSFKTYLARKGLQTLQQFGEEGLTEGAQSVVESAAADFVRMNRGELDTIEAWTTPEGRKETIGDVLQSMEEGGFIGALMGPFGGGLGSVQTSGDVQTGADVAANIQAAQSAQISPDVAQARAIMARLGGGAGQIGPAPGGVPPTGPQGPPPAAPPAPAPVAPPGSAPPGGETLPLPVGPEGAATLPEPIADEREAQRVRFMYAPEWIKIRQPLADAFARGDIDQDTMQAMIEAAAEDGIPEDEARQEIRDAIDKAYALVTGRPIEPMGEVTGEVPDRPPMGVPPNQYGQERLQTEGAPPITQKAPQRPPMGVTPDQYGQERLQTEGEPEPQAPAPAPREGALGRRREPRGREVDRAIDDVMNLVRGQDLNRVLATEAIHRIKNGESAYTVLSEDKFVGKLGQDFYDAASGLERAVTARIYGEIGAAKTDEEIFGPAEKTPEGPPPEMTQEEIEAARKGEPVAWQKTVEEFVGDATGDERAVKLAAHANQVKNAVKNGWEVPARVLRQYANNGWAKTALEKLEGKEVEGPETPPVTFAGGLQRSPSDIPRGRDILGAVGVALSSRPISENVRNQLANTANQGERVFIDTGAFGAFTRGEKMDWGRVFEQFREIIDRVNPRNRKRVTVVAPDIVGDQQGTLDLQNEHRGEIDELLDEGASVIVPVQKGEMSLKEGISEVLNLFDYSSEQIVIGVPFAKEAYTEEEVLDVVRSWKETEDKLNEAGGENLPSEPLRLHLLGAGLQKTQAIYKKARAIDPTVRISGDSALRGSIRAGRQAGIEPAGGEVGSDVADQIQMLRDVIATRKSKGEPVPQKWINDLAKLEGQEVAEGEAVPLEVFGHPAATNIGGSKYANLIPIKVSDVATIEKRIGWTQKLIDELQSRLVKRKGVKPLTNEEETVLDLLRNETMKELQRLKKELGSEEAPAAREKSPDDLVRLRDQMRAEVVDRFPAPENVLHNTKKKKGKLKIPKGTPMVRVKFENGRTYTYTESQFSRLFGTREDAEAQAEWDAIQKLGYSIHDFVKEHGGIRGFRDGSLSEELFGTNGRGGIPLEFRGTVAADEMLDMLKRAGLIAPDAEISDMVDALKEPRRTPETIKAEEEWMDRWMDEAYDEAHPQMDLAEEDATKEFIEAHREEETDEDVDEDGEPEEPGGEEPPPFSIGKPEPVKQAQSAAIKKAFPGWSMRRIGPNTFKLTRKGQPALFVRITRRKMTKEQLENAAANYGMTVEEVEAAVRAGSLAIKGSYVHDDITGAHLISLYAPKATQKTVFHEAFHFAFRNVLTAAQRKILVAAYGSEEAAARAYEAFSAKGPAARIFEIIKNFAKQLLGANDVNIAAAQAVMNKVASGKIYKQRGSFFTVTDPAGLIALRTVANTVVNAEQAAQEAEKARALEQKEFQGAVAAAIEEANNPFVHRGDERMFSIAMSADAADGQHPAMIIPEMTQTERFRNQAEQFLFDKLGAIRNLQESLTDVGRELDERFNAYLKAQNFQARAGGLVNWIENNLLEPFLDQMAAADVDLRDFDLFRMAAHALERNPKIREARVNRPLGIAQKKIEKLSKRKFSRGMKVRARDRGNTGTVIAVHPKMGKVEVEFVNPQNQFAKKTLMMDASQLDHEAVARAKDEIAEIRRMDEAGEIPNSGISDEDAKEILEEFRRLGMVSWTGELGPKTNYSGTLGDLSRGFTKIVRWKENALFRAGLLSKKELAKWRDYQHYAPMRGKDPDIMDIIANGRRLPVPQIEMYGGKLWHRALARGARAVGLEKSVHKAVTGKGYNPGRFPASHRALGRRSFPSHSPTVELFTDALQTGVRVEKNRVAQTIWNFVQSLKDAKDQNGEKLFEIDRPDSRLVWDERTETVKTKIDGLSVLKDNVYSVWVDGELHYIRAVSPEMAEFISALNNVGSNSVDDMASWWRAANAVNRYISSMATSRNPAFTIPNAFRDAITAGIKLLGEEQFQGFGLKTMKRAPEAWQILAEYARRQSKGTLEEMDPEKKRRVEAFKLAGGETAFWMIPDLDLQIRKMQASLEKARGDQARALQYGKNVINFIEDYNAAVEGAIRFSVFERALEMGISQDKAAKLARNITVDFTQQGTVARSLGTFYVFANASLQGSKMVWQASKSPRVRKIMLATAATALSWAPAMRFMGGEDEEDGIPWWDKISAYEKSRNMIFMIPGTKGKRIKIPLPWGFNVPWVVGQSISDAMFGPVTAGQGTMRIINSAMSAFNPIGDGDISTMSGLLQMLSPSWADPWLDIGLNKTFWGGPIRPESGKYARSEQYGVRTPDYNNYFPGVSKPSQEITRALYKYLGVDISPENIDYGIGAVFGGLGDLVNRTLNLAVAPLSKRRALTARDIPIVKSFYADEGAYFTPQLYRANMGDYWVRMETYKDLLKKDPKSAYEFRQRHREVLALEPIVKQTEQLVRDMRKSGIKSTDSRIQRQYKLFNRRFNTVEKKAMKRRLEERR